MKIVKKKCKWPTKIPENIVKNICLHASAFESQCCCAISLPFRVLKVLVYFSRIFISPCWGLWFIRRIYGLRLFFLVSFCMEFSKIFENWKTSKRLERNSEQNGVSTFFNFSEFFKFPKIFENSKSVTCKTILAKKNLSP